jgi:hypothetical protein
MENGWMGGYMDELMGACMMWVHGWMDGWTGE